MEEKMDKDISELEKNKTSYRETLINEGFLDNFNDVSEDEEAFTSSQNDAIADFLSTMNSSYGNGFKAHDWKINIPSSLIDESSARELMQESCDKIELYGFIREATETIYVIDKKVKGASKIGAISFDSQTDIKKADENFASGHFENGKLKMSLSLECPDGKRRVFDVRTVPYDAVTRLFSRNSGLLESSEMLDKCAVLIGCGSVGSLVAMELAKSGVGKFVLCDTDTLEIHNICRHQCGFEDLGRYKVDAVKDKILNINPNAEVHTYISTIQGIDRDEVKKHLGRNTIIIGGGDNRESSAYACDLAAETDCAFVATCCWTRAYAGEVYYWQSGHNLPCYRCAFSGLINSERPQSHNTYFGTDEDMTELAFEPGIAVDIDFVTMIALKVALDLINRDNPNYTPRVINYLHQYIWICNTNNTNIGGEYAAMFSNPLQLVNNLTLNKNEDCPICGDKS